MQGEIHMSDDAIHDILEQTESDPAFQALYDLFDYSTHDLFCLMFSLLLRISAVRTRTNNVRSQIKADSLMENQGMKISALTQRRASSLDPRLSSNPF